MVSPVVIDKNSQKTLLVVPAIFLVLATIAVTLRFRTRAWKKQRLLLDDWLCLVGLILSFCCYASIVVAVVCGGLGRSVMTPLMPDNIVLVFKVLESISVLWATTAATVQLAIIALYIRVFKVIRWHKYTCYAAMVFVFCWWASTFVTMLTTCIPLESFWNGLGDGKCIKLKQFCIASGLLHVFLDLFILSFPLPIIWKLKTSRSNRYTVTVAFLLGLFATIGGLLRMDCLIPIIHYDENDFTESAWIGVLFQVLENTCGVICSCAPMLSTYSTYFAESRFATSIRHFISSNLSRTSQRSSGSRASRRSARSGASRIEPQTIGSKGKNNHRIKKESTFAVTTYEGDSGEHLANVEASHSHVDGHSGRSVDIEMDSLSHGRV
ncbi:hypothetical protein K504DRAFT_465025 [Pleomassaria siparia CBS 279.74]|uniref:Rhodopsin domain-containing protein n=1 Tax=Pleomassaria siparia CBS 279.74 TaxID=1314801 RepID=A0A6G1KEI2_9PLEO|nr:hypothetical protein K504DRAFT_465025 [Pleomassaria siparia CBS 279.74]